MVRRGVGFGRRPFLFRRLDRLFLFKFLCDFDQGSRLVELRSQPDPSHLQGKELIASFWRACEPCKLCTTLRVLTTLFGIARHFDASLN